MSETREIYETYSEEETLEFAEKMGREASAGDIYCLDGDLGAGKTVFAKGFAKGLSIDALISSPTFNIIKEYSEGRLPLYHFDVYRIEEPEEMYELGYEEYFFGQGVCLIEWASLIEELIPPTAVHIRIERDMIKGADYRRIIIERED